MLRALRVASVLVAIGVALGVVGNARSQDAPVFHAGCGELRAAMDALAPRADPEAVVIAVTAPLAMLREGTALVYLGLCGPPAPRLVCVTYASNDRRIGDRVTVVGTLRGSEPDFILLDPCLHFLPEDEPVK